MGLYEQIREIAKSKGYSINRLEQELGFARSSINKFNKNKPSIDKLQQIADLLGVTVDCLTNGNETENSEHHEPELSNVYFSLAKEAQQNEIDPRDIKMAIEMLRRIREEEREEREKQGRKELK